MIDERDLVSGRDDGFLVLQSVARNDFNDRYFVHETVRSIQVSAKLTVAR